MANALEVEMSDFFGRQYDEAWMVDGNEIRPGARCSSASTRACNASMVARSSSSALHRSVRSSFGPSLRSPRNDRECDKLARRANQFGFAESCQAPE